MPCSRRSENLSSGVPDFLWPQNPRKDTKEFPEKVLFFRVFRGFRGKCFYLYQVISKRLNPGSGQASHCTSLTDDCGGPFHNHCCNDSSAACGPQAVTATRPSGRLDTCPFRPSACARSRVEARKKTPCTRPDTRQRIQGISGRQMPQRPHRETVPCVQYISRSPPASPVLPGVPCVHPAEK